MKSIFLCIELILIVATRNFEGINSSPLSSDLSSFGSEFYLGFPINFFGAKNLSFTIHTLKTTNVQFSVSSPYNNWQVSGTTTAGFPAVVDISTDLEVRGYSYSYRHLGLHISSLETEPISIVGWSYYAAHSFMAYLGLPCHEQPTNQYTYYGVSTNGYLYFVSTILLVACKNNTNITVVPSQNISIPVNLQSSISAPKTLLKGSSHSFILNAGQTLLLYKSYADLSGTKIVADAPLTVLSGHSLGQVPVGVTDIDPLVTQLTPTITWGKTFLLSPQPGRNNGQFYKVVAYRNNTNISRKCGDSNTINTTLTAGQVYQFSTSGTTYCSVISNRPIYIAQIGPSTLYNGGHSGDPTINTIPPIEQYIHSFEFSSFAPAYTYFSLLIPNDEYFNQGVVYDGVTYNFTWTNIYYPNGTIAGYGFNGLASGNHSIQHTHPQGNLFASICGWTTYGGHCYSGGMRLNPINPPVSSAEISFITDKFSVAEGNSAVVITLNRSVNYEEEVTVKVKVSPLPVDTATVNEDYQSTSVVVIFESDLTTKSLSIPIIDDNFVESTEYFTITLEAIGDNVLAFPITEAVVSIQDNDYIQIGFSSESLLLNGTNELPLSVSDHYGVLQPGEMVQVNLQVQDLSGASVSISQLDFQYHSRDFIAIVNLTYLPFSLNYNDGPIVKGKLVVDSSSVSVSVSPSVINVDYSQISFTQVVSTNSADVCLHSSYTAISTITQTTLITTTVTVTQTIPPETTSQAITTSTVTQTVIMNITTEITSTEKVTIGCTSQSDKLRHSSTKLEPSSSSAYTRPINTESPPSIDCVTSVFNNSSTYIIIIIALLIIVMIFIGATIGCFLYGRSKGKRRAPLNNELTIAADDYIMTTNATSFNPYEQRAGYGGFPYQPQMYSNTPLPPLPSYACSEKEKEEVYSDINETYVDMNVAVLQAQEHAESVNNK